MALCIDAYTTRELAPLLGIQDRAVRMRAAREGWTSRPRKGRGGGNEWLIASMPKATREAIAAGMLRQEAPATEGSSSDANLPAAPTAQPPALAGVAPLKHLTQRQRDAALARLAFVREVERLSAIVGRENAIMHLVVSAQEGTLTPRLASLVSIANDRYGTGEKRGISRRRLYAWCGDYAKQGETALAPRHRTADLSVPVWAPLFLSFYQRPQKPTLTEAYREFTAAYAEQHSGNLPSIHKVRRFIGKVATPDLAAGRCTGNALLKMRPHKRRSTAHMLPGDCYTADGTTFDAEVQNPHNGQPFKPEITIVIDVTTRRCVGIALALSESAQTVLDALRMACLFGGIPSMLYTDNGPGYKNDMLGGSLGLFERLGIEHATSIPGRPQGKGLMERAVQTICEPVAKRFPSCSHRNMDGDAAKQVYKITRRDIQLREKSLLLPTWEVFKDAMLTRVAEYNATPHRGLPKFTDANGKRRHMSPDEAWQSHVDSGWQPVQVPHGIEDELFMPAERRIVRNAEVAFRGGRYYAEELAHYHGSHVMVRYDVWDAAHVYVWTTNGQKICTAELDGNTTPYFQQSRIEAAREKRERQQLKRLERKAQAIAPGATVQLPEASPLRVVRLVADSLTPAQVLPAHADTIPASAQAPEAAAHITVDVTPLRPLAEPVRRPCFNFAHERYEWLMRHRDHWQPKDEPWLRDYIQTEEYAENRDRYAFEGIAWGGPATSGDASR